MAVSKLAAALLIGLACSGCVTTEDLRAADEARCRSYGFRVPSDAFANCLLQLDLGRSAERRARFEGIDAGFYGPSWYGGRRW